MTQTDLVTAFAVLDSPASLSVDAAYAVAQIPASRAWLLGKDSSGSAALLLELPPDLSSHDLLPIELENLSVSHGVTCVVSLVNGPTRTARFSILRCAGEADVQAYFLRLGQTIVDLLGDHITESDLSAAVHRLVALFRAMRQAPRRSVRGLWAELLVIASAADVKATTRAWHATPEDAFDFASGSDRIEVKSFVAPPRFHEFSLTQLQPPTGVQSIVASILVRSSASGPSVAGLEDEVVRAVADDPQLVTRTQHIVAETLGDAWRDGSRLTFDRQAAIDSVRWYRVESIPQIPANSIPAGVTDVRFRASLEGVASIPNSELTGNTLWTSIGQQAGS